MAQRSTRRDRENQIMDTRLERARLNWTRSANSHTGRRHVTSRSRGRTHVSTRPRSVLFDKILLAPMGASTHVHDDDVALAQFRNKDALDIGLEGDAIDRAVEHERRDHAARGQASDESRRFPMAVRDADTQAFAAAAAAVGPRHAGRSPGLVDEDQAFGIEIELALEPGLALLQDVGSVLLRRVRGLFLRVMAWRAKKRRIVP